MRTERRNSKSSWPKVVVKKWLNIKNGTADHISSDYLKRGMLDSKCERRKSCSDKERYVVVPEDFSEGLLMEANDSIQRPRFEDVSQSQTLSDNLRMFVGTWNVGGKSPNEGLNLRDWLRTPTPADIYVLGFQEIVPLNAGNVLGPEDNGPAATWLSLIRRALNNYTNDPEVATNYKSSRLSFSDLISMEDELNIDDFQKFLCLNNSGSNSSEEGSPPGPMKRGDNDPSKNGYILATSKQMVGIFLCVWVRSDLYRHINRLKVSCVGRGIMGYLGNKGSISISMTLHGTTFCFVCTHLASGEKDGDEVRRNSDVIEILKRTRFSHSHRGTRHTIPPESILEHDKVIWLGDLNYRLATRCDDMHELLQKNDWRALLEKDQLKIEQKAGRVFKGWEEGMIYFAPTYKYLINSDYYVVQPNIPKQKHKKEKQRTPAWCDRILWKGEGLRQIWYVRGESKFSDHRPVYSLFSVQVKNNTNPEHITQNTLRPATSSSPRHVTVTNSMSQTCIAKVQAEEFLNVTRVQSCINSTSRF